MFSRDAKHLLMWTLMLVFVLWNTIGARDYEVGQDQTHFLTQQEKEWLAAHPAIRLAPDPNFPPTEFFDENGKYSGITADFIVLIEERLGIKFDVVKLKDWDEVIEKARSKQIDMLGAYTETPQRRGYLLFTSPYLEQPIVIIVRDEIKESLTLEKIRGMKVAVAFGSLDYEYLSIRYPDLELDIVPNIPTGLRKVSFGMVDVMITDMATATYFIEREGITNLSIAGETGYSYKLAFASRKDWPELNSILQKGLEQISRNQRRAILNKWIHLKHPSFLVRREFWIALIAGFGVTFLVIVGILGWNRSLKKQVSSRTEELNRELTERRKAEKQLKKSLKEKDVLLKEVHHRVKNNLQVISSLLNLQSEQIRDKHALELFRDSQDRVRSMALIHEKLYQSKDLESVDFSEYVRSLVTGLFRAYETDVGRVALEVKVEEVTISIDSAIPCGLIINELVSNSLKYGFPPGWEGRGKIRIALHPIDEDGVELIVGDNGVGIPKDLDIANVESLGLKLVMLLAEDQLGGKVRIERRGGTKFIIKFRESLDGNEKNRRS